MRYFQVVDFQGWRHISYDFPLEMPPSAGRWTVFFPMSETEAMGVLAEKAVEEGACFEAWCSRPEENEREVGSLRLFGCLDDWPFQKKATDFLIRNRLVNRTASGFFQNIPFTMANVSPDLPSSVGLRFGDIRDLRTGAWIQPDRRYKHRVAFVNRFGGNEEE